MEPPHPIVTPEHIHIAVYLRSRTGEIFGRNKECPQSCMAAAIGRRSQTVTFRRLTTFTTQRNRYNCVACARELNESVYVCM